jgi:hypothetical protein
MTPERWRQLKEPYHSARERGPAVLAGLAMNAPGHHTMVAGQ